LIIFFDRSRSGGDELQTGPSKPEDGFNCDFNQNGLRRVFGLRMSAEPHGVKREYPMENDALEEQCSGGDQKRRDIGAFATLKVPPPERQPTAEKMGY
jgi:hypothetical protein